MTPQEQESAKAQGYNVVLVSGPSREETVDITIKGVRQNLSFGTPQDAWAYIQNLRAADSYNH
jgi:predicted RNA-binding protein with TRAM domain